MSLVFPPIEISGTRWAYDRTLIFGVVNVTPDSFSDGGRFWEDGHLDVAAAVAQGEALVAGGADALDVGGESTRPHATPVSEDDERRRVLPVIAGLADRVDIPISIDSYKASVARDAVAAGATIINDVSGGSLDDDLYTVAAESGALLILGHLRGAPASMMDAISFDDVVQEVEDELRGRIRRAVEVGVRPDRLWIDPGIGFGKDAAQSEALIAATGRLRSTLGYPIMLGPSRKSFIGQVTGKEVRDRLMGTAGAACVAVARGVDALRLHDVAALRDAIRVADAICRPALGGGL